MRGISACRQDFGCRGGSSNAMQTRQSSRLLPGPALSLPGLAPDGKTFADSLDSASSRKASTSSWS
jgi:hypothetical protein